MSDKKRFLKAVLLGSVCALLITIILLCLCSAAVLTSGLLPRDITNYVVLALLALGTLFGGFVTARITKSAGLVVGLITGFAVFIIVTASGLIHSSESVTILTLIRLLCELAAGAVGGILGVNKKEKIKI